MTRPSATCHRCGAPLRASEARGLCPACLLETSLGSEDDDANNAVEIDTAWLERQGLTSPRVAAEGARRFGDYELFEEIGRGGMGVIYRANQLSLQRTVAIKTILTGPLAGPDFVQRFQTEAHAAAVLDHPNIVPIYEVGDHQGQPYYSMPLISGRNLAQALKQDGPLPARQAATLIATVARAIHYAHQRGILHRDLKPANIMLDAGGQPHVTDFGLAKLLEQDDGLTLTQAALGTPNYMAPEQAAGNAADLTTAADTYSLGSILFEVLTGQRLFAAATPLATINRAREQKPPRPSAIWRGVPRDLDTICLKCLEKEPGRRYASAQALAEDLERWLAGEPIRARRVGAVERLGLWCRRKPAMAAMAGSALLVVLIASGIATWRVTAARQQKELEQYSANIRLADAYIRDGATDRALELLLQCPPKFRHWEWGRLVYLCHQEIATISAHTNRAQYLLASLIQRLTVNRDGTRLVTQGTDGTVKLWDSRKPEALVEWADATNAVSAWALHPEGRQLAVGMQDGTLRLFDAVEAKLIWSIARKAAAGETNGTRDSPSPARPIVRINYNLLDNTPILEPLTAQPESVVALNYAPDGKKLAIATGNGEITVRDAATGRELAAWRHSLSKLQSLWFTPDGAQLVARGTFEFKQFESDTGKMFGTHRWDSKDYEALFLDASGHHAVTLDRDRNVQLWRDGEKTHALGRMGGKVDVHRRVWFDLAGRRLCLAGTAGTARLHDVATGRLMFSVPHNVIGAAFSFDGGRLVTYGPDRLIRLWDVERGQELRVLRGHLSVPHQAVFSSDGNFIATASRNGMVKLWTGTAGRERVLGEGWPSAATYSRDGRLWAMALGWNGACVFDAHSGKLITALPYRQMMNFGIAFSPDGRFLLTVGTDKLAQIWDFREQRLDGLLRGHDRSVISATWSRDGKWIATGDSGGVVRIWDAATRRELRNLKAHPQFAWCVQFDPSGRKLLTAGYGPAKIWEVESGRLLTSLEDDGGRASGATFSPDGLRVVMVCLDHQIRFWDAESGRLVQGWTGRSQGVIWDYSPDGRRLVLSVSDHGSGGMGAPSLEIWDVQHDRRLLDVQGHTDSFFGSIFSPDGRRILTSSLDHTARQWETFPWLESEFASFPGKTLPERIRRYAEHYWQERLAAEHAGGAATNLAPVSLDELPSRPEWEKVYWPVRATSIASNLLNLDAFYTAALNAMFYPSYLEMEFDDELSRVPVGEQILGGIPFDVRGVVVLQCGNQTKDHESLWPLWRRHPVRAEDIRVGSKVRRIHMLHAAKNAAAESEVIGSYVLHYADGTRHELEIVYGRDLRDWWHGGRGDPSAEVTQAKVGWTGSNPVADRYKASVRLFVRTYDNPRPDVEVVSIDFASKLTAAAPFLVAMTVEPSP